MVSFPRLLTAVAAALLFCATSLPARAADVDDASKFLNDVGTQAIAAISSTGLSKDQKQKKLEAIFASTVDIPWVGRFVLGRFWRDASDDQKTRYLKEYQKFLILHYTSRFSDYTGGSFKLTGGRDDGNDEYTVSMQIHGNTAGSEPVSVDYRIRKEQGGFKIFDIIVEGVSLITTQRSEFSSVVTNRGLDYLITQLANRKVASSFPDAK